MKKTLSLLLALLLVLSCLPALAVAEDEATPLKVYMKVETEFDPATNPIVPALEEACGIKLEYVLPPISSYDEKLNLMVTSGDYPDMVLFSSHTSPAFLDSAKNGILLPIDEYVENYENLQKFTDPSSWIALRSAVPDGVLYGVPRNSVMRTDGWLVRTDWLDAVGIQIDDCSALTQQEFYDILYAFTKKDPDGNGKDDTYGLATGTMAPLFPSAFGEMGWQKAESGEYEYIDAKYDMESSAYVDALAYTAQLWKDGLIDPNDITNTGNAYRDRFYDGTVGMVRMFGGWLNTYEDNLHENFPGVETKYIVGIQNEDGECIGTSSLGGNVYGFTALMTPCADKIDKALGLLDYMISDEGWSLVCDGVEGWTYTVDETGKRVATEAFSDFAKYRNSLSLVRRFNDPGYFVLLNNTTYDRSWQYIQAACDITVLTADMGYSPAAAQSNDYKDFATEVSVATNDILIGNQPADAWYTVLADWYEFGGKAYVEEMNEFIKSLN